MRNPAAVIALALLLGACNPSFKDDANGEFAAEGLYPVSSSGFEEAHARRDAALSSYRIVSIGPLQLDETEISQAPVPGTTRRNWQITPEREQVLLEAWDQAMQRAFQNHEQSGSGDAVLQISSSLLSVRARPRSVTGTLPAGVQAGGSGDVVELVMEIRLYDQGSGRLLAVVRDRRDVLMAQWTRANGRDLRSLFNSWASLLAARVAG